MRTIVKGPEPAVLAHYRALHAHYGHLTEDDKEVLRACLAREQRGLCCYCMSRIHPERDQMKIAHWHAQSVHPEEQLDYANLLAACLGNQGQPRKHQHCDTRQGDQDISVSPANPAHAVEQRIQFGSDGTIRSNDPQLDRELNEVLNLNVAFLKHNRKATLDGFLQSLPRQGALSRHSLERWVLEWSGQSHADNLRPFCQVVVYWLRKRVARMQS